MIGLSILMLIFSILTFLAGLYIYTGHNSEILLWRTYRKNTPLSELKNIGKWTMISSIIPLIISVVGLFF